MKFDSIKHVPNGILAVQFTGIISPLWHRLVEIGKRVPGGKQTNIYRIAKSATKFTTLQVFGRFSHPGEQHRNKNPIVSGILLDSRTAPAVSYL